MVSGGGVLDDRIAVGVLGRHVHLHVREAVHCGAEPREPPDIEAELVAVLRRRD